MDVARVFVLVMLVAVALVGVMNVSGLVPMMLMGVALVGTSGRGPRRGVHGRRTRERRERGRARRRGARGYRTRERREAAFVLTSCVIIHRTPHKFVLSRAEIAAETGFDCGVNATVGPSGLSPCRRRVSYAAWQVRRAAP